MILETTRDNIQKWYNKDMLNRGIFKKAFLFLIFVFNFYAPIAHAQFQEGDVTFRINPNFPRPGESVQVQVSSFVVDLDKALIVWSVNGQERINGVGKKIFSFNLDNIGQKTQVSVSITLANGSTFTKSTYVSATEIDILWEAVDSYTPPFYKGKALGVREGSFKVVAIPNITSSKGQLKPSNLSYTWKKDGNVQVSSSGFGKSGFIFKNSYLDKVNEIEVEISDIEKNTKTGGKITIAGINTPEIVFYKKDPELGVLYNKALLDGYSLGKEPETLVATPYFFSVKNLFTDTLKFSWKAGGEEIRPDTLKNEVTLVAPQDTRGGTDIVLEVQNANSLFQNIKKKINVTF